MLYKGQYVPTEVTNYTDPLSRAVQRQKQQIEAWGREQQIHSQNLRNTDPGVTNLELTKASLKFLETAAASYGKYKSAKEQAKAGKEKRDKNKWNGWYVSNPEIVDDKTGLSQYDRINGQLEGEKAVKAGSKEFKKLVDIEIANKTISESYGEYLKSSSADELLAHRGFLATEWLTKNATTEYHKSIEGLSREALQARQEQVAHNPAFVQQEYAEFVSEHFATKLGLTKDYTLTHFGTEVKEQADTVGTIAGVDFKVKALTAKNIEVKGKIDNARLSYKSGQNPNVFTELTQNLVESLSPIVDGKRDYATGRVKAEAMLTLQAGNGQLTQEELGLIREGFNDGTVPGGPTGDALLSKEAFDRIGKVITAVDEQAVAAHKAEVEKRYNSSMATFAKGEGTEQQKADDLAWLQNNGYDVNSKEYRALENMELKYQSPQYYKVEKAEVLERFNNGDLSLADLEGGVIKNTRLQIEMKDKLNKLKQSKSDNDFPDNYKTKAKDYVLQGTVGNVIEGAQIPPTSQPIQDYIQQQAEKIYLDEYLRAPEGDRNIGSRAEKRLLDLITAEGLFVKVGNPGAGKLSSTTDNKFPAFHAWDDATTIELTGGSDLTKTFNKINEAYKHLTGNGRNDTERLINSKGSVLSIAELIAVAENTDTKGNLKFWPKDILTKSHYLKIEPSVLVQAQLNAYVKGVGNDEGAKLMVQVHGLEKLAKNLPTLDVDLRKQIQTKAESPNATLEEKNLLALYQAIGIENFSNNQQRRVLAVIEETSNKRVRLERLKALGIKKYPASALESDEALDAFITKQGLLETE